MAYKWKAIQMPVAAQVAGEYLEALEAKNGKLTPKIIVDDSRDENAVLHSCFEWRDGVAAEKYRERQAGDIIRNIVVINENTANKVEKQPVRAFVSVVVEEEHVYTPVRVALSDAELREQVLQRARNELISFQLKYKNLTELSGLMAKISEYINETETEE